MLQRSIVALQHRTNGMSSVQAKFLPVGLFAVFGIVFVGGMTKHGILHLLPHFHILFADIGQHLNRTLLHHFAHTGVELILLFLKESQTLADKFRKSLLMISPIITNKILQIIRGKQGVGL